MRSSTFVLGLLAALLPTSISQATASNAAPVASGNPPGAQYIATLPVALAVNGAIVVSSTPDGNGVSIQATINNLPSSGGPFLYHIHTNPVADKGNCSTTGGHLDPYNVTDLVVCDDKNPQNCQVGDLSGKHGTVPGPSFSANYIDKYISTIPGSPAFVGNRSIVVHYNNKTIITCANFTQNGQSSPASSGNGAGGSVSSVVAPAAAPPAASAPAASSPAANPPAANPSAVSPAVGGAPGVAPVSLVSTITVSGSAQTVTVSAPSTTTVSAAAAPPAPIVSTVIVSGAVQTVTVTSAQGANGV